MPEFNFVNANDVNSLEQYAAATLISIGSLRTLELYQQTAMKKGLIEGDMEETLKTICWEIQRLLALYQSQMNLILEKTGIDEDDIIESFRKTVPNVNMPRKRKKKDG